MSRQRIQALQAGKTTQRILTTPSRTRPGCRLAAFGGATSAIYPANDGNNIWIAERCGENLCAGSDLDPVMLFDTDGNVLMSFGSGKIIWSHGMYVDADDNIWIADAVRYAPMPDGVGHTVMKFSRTASC